MIKTGCARALAGVAVVGTLAAVALGASLSVPLGLAGLVCVQPESPPAWLTPLGLVDEALERSEMSRTIHEWREAHGATTRTNDPHALIAVAQRAVRIADLSVDPGYFLHEARYIYQRAASRARAERSPDAIHGV